LEELEREADIDDVTADQLPSVPLDEPAQRLRPAKGIEFILG